MKPGMGSMESAASSSPLNLDTIQWMRNILIKIIVKVVLELVNKLKPVLMLAFAITPINDPS